METTKQDNKMVKGLEFFLGFEAVKNSPLLEREGGGKILSSKEEDGESDLSHKEEGFSVITEEVSQQDASKDLSINRSAELLEEAGG